MPLDVCNVALSLLENFKGCFFAEINTGWRGERAVGACGMEMKITFFF